ncbi:MAG: PAS domain-containing protein [Chloroflexi bacterium]|nr:PAS domain-containing protein [Chloroflexota bacterium]
MAWWPLALGLALVGWAWTAVWLGLARRRAAQIERALGGERVHRQQIESTKESLDTINRSFIEQAPAAMLLVQPDGRVTYANQAATDLIRLDAGVGGRRLIELVPDHDLNQMVRHVLEGSQAQSRELSPPGSHLVLLASVRPISSEHGYLLGAAVVLENLTEVRRLEAMRRDLLANVSHELRTPLAGMKALVETLESGAMHDPLAAAGFLAKLHGELDRLSFLVRDVLELSRIESGGVRLALQSVSLPNLVADAVERLQPETSRAGVTVEVLSGPRLHVLADPQRCGQILVNLLQNAARFTPAGGRIELAWESAASEAVVHVRDSGVGISEDDLPRIFERFYKVDKARVHADGSGTGLGLAIVKHLATAMGGRVGVASQLGGGSDFWFTVPLAAATEPVASPA